MGGITQVPTARRALAGVVALTVAGIAAAGPAQESPAESQAVAAPVAAAADTGTRLVALRAGIHIGETAVRHGQARAGRGARVVTPTGTQARTVRRTKTLKPRAVRVVVRIETERAERHIRPQWKKAKEKRQRAESRRESARYRGAARATGELGQVIEYALDQVGKPYRRNSAGPGSYDCSGLVSVAYRKAGVKLPHSSHAIARKGKKVRRGDLRPGDVVLPQSGHVGIYLGDGKMVHAATPRKGVVVSKMYGFSTARRLM